MSNKKKPVIVILGGGFGGAYCAQALEKKLTGKCNIILVDRNNYFIFYPLLIEAGTGDLEPRHAVISIRQFLKHTFFQMGEISTIDTSSKEVTVKVPADNKPETINYDHLVLSLGSVTNLPEISGLKEYAYQMKSLPDAVALRDRAIQLLEKANLSRSQQEIRSLLHFVIVGGNFTGVEVAGQFDEFLKKASRAYNNIKAADCKVTLVELSDRILNILDADLSEFASKSLQRRGIDVLLNTTLSQINSKNAVLDSGTTLSTCTVVWCAGIAPNPVTSKLDIAHDKRGYILCEPNLRVKGEKDVWAIGDSALNPDKQGKPYPATAQHAVGEARVLADNIRRVIKGQEPQPCNLKSKGTLAALGCRTAVARILGVKLSGFLAWFLWRTIYLSKMPGWSRRLRITLDWTIGLLFKRDYVQLGVHKINRPE